MNVVLHEIDEKMARINRELWSFTEYKPNSYTDMYREEVAEVERIAEKQKPLLNGEKKILRLEKLVNKYSRWLAAYYNRDIKIQGMCPSLLIVGGSNFPVRKKEKQLRAQEDNNRFYDRIKSLRYQIAHFAAYSNGIRTDDDDAVEMLLEKVEAEKHYHAQMLAMNKHYRKHKTMQGFGDLTEQQAWELDEKIKASFSSRKIPYAPFELDLSNAKIKRLQERIKSIRFLKEKEPIDFECEYFRIEENKEDMRIRFFFDGKPSREVIQECKGYGFKWSPRNMAWQRQTTVNALHAARSLKVKLLEIWEK